MWLDRSIEFWIALISAALYVYERSAEDGIIGRIIKVAISAGLGFALARELGEWSGLGEVIAGVTVTTLGYLILDVVSVLVQDREFLKELIKERFKR